MAESNNVHCASCGEILEVLDWEYLQFHPCFQNLPENLTFIYSLAITDSGNLISFSSSPKTEELQEQLIVLVQEKSFRRFSNLSNIPRPLTCNNEAAIEVNNILAASTSRAPDSSVQQRPTKRLKTSHATINAAARTIVTSFKAPTTGLDGFLIIIRELLLLFMCPRRRLEIFMDILQLIRYRLPDNLQTKQ